MLALLLAFTLVFESKAGCDLDTATVKFVPPATAGVLVTEQCGAIQCRVKWVEYDGRRIHEELDCDVDPGEMGDGATQHIQKGGS